jgi:hypothetical protein
MVALLSASLIGNLLLLPAILACGRSLAAGSSTVAEPLQPESLPA